MKFVNGKEEKLYKQLLQIAEDENKILKSNWLEHDEFIEFNKQLGYYRYEDGTYLGKEAEDVILNLRSTNWAKQDNANWYMAEAFIYKVFVKQIKDGEFYGKGCLTSDYNNFASAKKAGNSNLVSSESEYCVRKYDMRNKRNIMSDDEQDTGIIVKDYKDIA